MPKKKDTKRIVMDLKPDEVKRLERAAEVDMLPVKSAARKYVLLGLLMKSDKKGQQVYPTGLQAIAEMPF